MTAKTLKEAVILKYHSISAFARAAYWSIPKASRVANESQHLTAPEIRHLIRLLELKDPEEIVRLFRLIEEEEHTT